MSKSFEQLLFEGALTAVRSLTLDELYAQAQHLQELNLPDDIAEFPISILEVVIREKQLQRAMN